MSELAPKNEFMVVVEFDRGLLNHFTVASWNVFMEDLQTRGLIPACWEDGQRPPPVTVELDFRRLQRAHYKMDGIDLSLCHLDESDFTMTSLKNARLGSGRNVIYRGARLHGADFKGVEISGNDFTDCQGVKPALFEGAYYDPSNPPKGLPPEVLAVCLCDDDEPARLPRERRSIQHDAESPLRACVTIQQIPVE